MSSVSGAVNLGGRSVW